MKRLALAACAAALVVAGCGTSQPDQPVAAGTTLMTRQDFVRRTSDAWVKKKTAHLKLQIGYKFNGLSAEGDMVNGATAKDSAFDAHYKTPGLSYEVLAVDAMIYLNYGAMTKHKFVAVDPTDTGNFLSKQFAPVVESLDPATAIKALKGSILEFERSGKTKSLDGVKTTAYRIKISTTALKKTALGKTAPEGSIPDTITYLYYVGPDDVPRRVTYTVQGVDASINYTDVGKPVTIVAPEKSDQIDQSVLNGLRGT